MPFQLPDLPFAADALEPVVSAHTIAIHHGKHHRAYVENLNRLVANTAYEGLSIEDVRAKALLAEDTAVANNAGQHIAHSLYWHSLSGVVTQPPAELATQVEKDFGSLASLSAQWVDLATKHFGSGWAWLVWTGDELALATTSNAATPYDHGHYPLLVIDVWEHAYYLDWENRRAAHLEALMPLLNWEHAGHRFAARYQA